MRTIHTQALTDEASIGAARRGVHAYAAELGFGERARSELDIVVQEIGTNAVVHARANQSTPCALHWTLPGVVTPASDQPTSVPAASFHFSSAAAPEHCLPDTRCGIELFYADKGPGIYDLEHALDDNTSFGGGLGAGFGAIRRLTDEFHIYSLVRRTQRLTLSAARRTTHGTAILCRKWIDADGRRTRTARVVHAPEPFAVPLAGAWSRPRPGETENGDAYHIRHDGSRTLVAVVDGLGHGAGAATASRVALDTLDDWRDEPLDALVLAAHDALRATRGAVMSVALIDRANSRMQFAGVGNISTRVYNSPQAIHPIPINGTLGARLVKVPVWTYSWAEGTILIMASDGVSASWDMSHYPNLLAQHPQIVAGVLMRDYERDSDDATVVVIR